MTANHRNACSNIIKYKQFSRQQQNILETVRIDIKQTLIPKHGPDPYKMWYLVSQIFLYSFCFYMLCAKVL